MGIQFRQKYQSDIYKLVTDMGDSSNIYAVRRRKGYFDITPTVAIKKALVVGVWPIADHYYLYHDLTAKGIPYDIVTWTIFVANYDTDAWKAKYDIIIAGGDYVTTDTVNPVDVKPCVTDIILNNKYKFIQISTFGQKRAGQTSAYWFGTAMGLTTSGGAGVDADLGTVNCGADADHAATVKDGGGLAQDQTYTVYGQQNNALGTGWTKLVYIDKMSDGTTSVDGRFCVVKGNVACIVTELGVYNQRTDVARVVSYMRNIKSHIAFNRYYGKKYIAWGYDGDRSNSVDAIYNLLETNTLGRPWEYSLVTSKLTPECIRILIYLQTLGLFPACHSISHLGLTGAPAVNVNFEWVYGIDDLLSKGLYNNGVNYGTGTFSDINIIKPSLDKGFLMCGYVQGLRCRNDTQTAFGKPTDNLLISAQLGIFPFFGSTITDDIYNMGTNGADSANIWVQEFNKANTYPYEWPPVFYFHDSPSDPTYNGGTITYTIPSGKCTFTSNTITTSETSGAYFGSFKPNHEVTISNSSISGNNKTVTILSISEDKKTLTFADNTFSPVSESGTVTLFVAVAWKNQYYDISNGMERRKQYYKDVFAFIDSTGYTQLRRSQAVELIYDLVNCVGITSETITTGVGVTVKVASKRTIQGATIAIPTENKTIASVVLSVGTYSKTITDIERLQDNSWLYVGFDTEAGIEQTITVTYA